jgi:zinc transporter ZupT
LTVIASFAIAAPLAATAIGVSGVVLGLWLTGAHRRARIVLPFSAGLLLGVVCFGLLPELIEEDGWLRPLLLSGCGYGLLLLVNRYVAPVCPSCGHDHDHAACDTVLHGFAAPLISASALHCFFDGWSIATAQWATGAGIRVAVPLAVALHKIPEGLALGGIVRASMRSRPAAFWWCVLAESCTLVGGIAGAAIAPALGSAWITYPLGLAAGWLCYLGAHALHEEWRARGVVPASITALAGAAAAAALQQGVTAWLR